MRSKIMSGAEAETQTEVVNYLSSPPDAIAQRLAALEEELLRLKEKLLRNLLQNQREKLDDRIWPN